MSVSTRTRFEVLKRDGFRCRYCGLTAMATELHVDHVVPASKGGTDDPVNLVAACSGCNLGKSDKPLDECALPPAETGPQSLEAAREHVDQIRAYLESQKLVEAAREEVREWLCDRWRELCGNDPPRTVADRFRAIAQEHPLTRITDAIAATQAAAWRLRGDALRETRYFHACLKNLAEADHARESCAARAAELHALIREGSESWEDVQIMLRELVEMASQ